MRESGSLGRDNGNWNVNGKLNLETPHFNESQMSWQHPQKGQRYQADSH